MTDASQAWGKKKTNQIAISPIWTGFWFAEPEVCVWRKCVRRGPYSLLPLGCRAPSCRSRMNFESVSSNFSIKSDSNTILRYRHLPQTAKTLPAVQFVKGFRFSSLLLFFCFPSKWWDTWEFNLNSAPCNWNAFALMDGATMWGAGWRQREIIRCSYKLLAASFVFLMESMWSRDWHKNALTAVWWMLNRF